MTAAKTPLSDNKAALNVPGSKAGLPKTLPDSPPEKNWERVLKTAPKRTEMIDKENLEYSKVPLSNVKPSLHE